MDERERYFEYVARQIRQARLRWRILPGIAWLLSAPALLIEHKLVENYRWLGTTQDVAQYMLKKLIFQFSPAVFWSLCTMEGCSKVKTLLLLFIYYSYYAFTVVGFLGPILLLGTRLLYRRSVGRERITFCRVMQLHKCLDDLSREPQPSVRRRAMSLVRSLRLHRTISPLKLDWQKKPTLDWFSENPLKEDAIRVLGALRAFRRKALYCLRHNSDLSRLADVVDELATFLYLANVRKETSYRSPDAETTAEQRLGKLVSFANGLNRIQARREAKRGIGATIADLLSALPVSGEVRAVVAIAIVAAVVMLLGSILFDVPARTAFVAWFTVVFGSLAVSIGVTSMVLRGER